MGIYRFFVSLFLLLISSASFASEIDLETGLVAHYKFDGDFNDSSGTGNHGAQQGGVTFVEGVDGQAAYFDGNDDYIIVPHSDSLALNRNLTLSVRLRAEQRAVENCFYISNGCPVAIFIKDSHYPNNFSLWTRFQLDSVWFQQYRSSLSGQVSFPVEASLFSEDYITISVVRTEGEVVIYLEGEEVQRFNADYDAVQRSGPLYIGYDGGWGYGKYKGVIDDLKIYDRALSDSEVIELATSPIIFSQDNEDIGLSGIGTQYDIENTLNGSISFSEDTLTVTNTSGIVDSVRSIHSISSGKHYWEVTAHCGPDTLGFEAGVIASGGKLHDSYSNNGDIWSILSDGAKKNSPYYQVMTEGFLQTFEDDTFQFAVDMDNNKIYYGKNGLWLSGADPVLSLNPAADDLSDEVYAFFWLGNRECSTLSATTNFGATQFKYDVPIGYFKGFCPSGECVLEGDSDGVDSDDGAHDSDDTNHDVTSAVLDIDANGSFDALTDGLIILRYAFGLRGQALINNVIPEDAMRNNASDIETYIETLLP